MLGLYWSGIVSCKLNASIVTNVINQNASEIEWFMFFSSFGIRNRVVSLNTTAFIMAASELTT